MMELLLARMNASIKEHMQEMKADKKADQARMEAKTNANRGRDREDLKRMEEMNAKMDGNQAEMRSILCTFSTELKETIRQMRTTIQSVRSELDEMIARNKATETEPDPRMMQSIEEHQENRKGEVAVMPVREPRKRRSVCNLAVERHLKRKGISWIQEGVGYHLQEGVPPCKSGMLEKEPLQEYSDPRKLWTIEGIVR
jgi:hypothetical protein